MFVSKKFYATNRTFKHSMGTNTSINALPKKKNKTKNTIGV